MALRDDQRVPWRDWKAISNHHAMLAGGNDSLRGQTAKSTRFGHWASLEVISGRCNRRNGQASRDPYFEEPPCEACHDGITQASREVVCTHCLGIN